MDAIRNRETPCIGLTVLPMAPSPQTGHGAALEISQQVQVLKQIEPMWPYSVCCLAGWLGTDRLSANTLVLFAPCQKGQQPRCICPLSGDYKL